MTRFEQNFYKVVCGTCYIRRNWQKNQPLMGEWTRGAKAEKEAHSKDILQPLNQDGTINKHFLEVNGTRAYKKELKLTKEQFNERNV